MTNVLDHTGTRPVLERPGVQEVPTLTLRMWNEANEVSYHHCYTLLPTLRRRVSFLHKNSRTINTGYRFQMWEKLTVVNHLNITHYPSNPYYQYRHETLRTHKGIKLSKDETSPSPHSGGIGLET